MNTTNSKSPTNELDAALKSKVVPLKEAIRRYIKPGMTVHLAGGIGGPGAATCEIIRQFYGKKPEFALVQSTVTGHSLNLLYCDLLRKLIFSACMDLSTSSRPSRSLISTSRICDTFSFPDAISVIDGTVVNRSFVPWQI